MNRFNFVHHNWCLVQRTAILPFHFEKILLHSCKQGGEVLCENFNHPGGPQKKNIKNHCFRGLPSVFYMFKVNILEPSFGWDLECHNCPINVIFCINAVTFDTFVTWGHLHLSPLETKYIHSHITFLRLSPNQILKASTC